MTTTTTEPTDFSRTLCARCQRRTGAVLVHDDVLCSICAAADEACPCCGGVGQQADGDDCACIGSAS
jgi:hypothetical protein